MFLEQKHDGDGLQEISYFACFSLIKGKKMVEFASDTCLFSSEFLGWVNLSLKQIFSSSKTIFSCRNPYSCKYLHFIFHLWFASEILTISHRDEYFLWHVFIFECRLIYDTSYYENWCRYFSGEDFYIFADCYSRFHPAADVSLDLDSA